MRTNATKEELNKALKEVNKKYDNNIIFNREPEEVHYNNLINFTMKVKDSKKAGHRIGNPQRDYNNGTIIKEGRRLINACWHVHGDFFDALFDINPDLYVYCGKDKITREHGNWNDRNIGSQMYPYYHSEACACE